MTKKCFVPQCKSGYDSMKGKGNKVSLFSAPKKKDTLEIWQKAIRRTDRKLTSSDVVCELHFNEYEILRFFDAEKTLKRVIPLLSPDAIPSKFPKCPKYLSKRTPPPRKSNRRQRTVCGIPAVKVAEVQASDSNIHTSGTDEADPTTLDESIFTVGASIINLNLDLLKNITFEELKAGSFNKENWSKLVLEKTIRYLYWPENEFLCTKYVEIGENLAVKVVFGEVCTGFVGYKTITSLYKLEELIEMVEKANICHGAILNKHKRCGGFAKHGKNFCGSCTLRVTLVSGGKKIANTARNRGRHINQNMKRKMGRLQGIELV